MELQLDLNKRYTFADYLTWMDDKRRELIDGKIFEFKNGNPTKHQSILGALMLQFNHYCKKNKIECYNYIDVRFYNDYTKKSNNEIFNVVQPEFFIVCDKNKLDDLGCVGSPDLIIEIIAKETVERDIKYKFELYQKMV